MTDDHRDSPAPQHRRPEGLSDETAQALGKASEALETVERARGYLYSFHQLIGHADLQLDEAVQLLRDAGHTELADRLQDDMVGRNVVEGRWTFQLVEEFDDGYWRRLRAHEESLREELSAGRRHLHEAEMKEARRTHGKPGHEARPPDARSHEGE